MSRWLCLFNEGIDESTVETYARDGFSIVVGPDHRGFRGISPISLVALEADSVVVARQARALWQRLGETPTATGRSLRDELTDDHVSLWDVCATNIILYYLQKLCRNADSVDRLFETQGRPERIVVERSDDLAARWIEQRALSARIPFEVLGSRRRERHLIKYRAGLHERLRRLRNRCYSTLTARAIDGQGEALFLGFVDRQLDSMIPVALELREREGIPVRFFLPLSSTRRAELRKKGFRCDAYESFTPSPSAVSALCARLDRSLTLIDADPIFQAYSRELRPRLRDLLLRAAEYRALARSVLERLSPGLLVTSDVNHPLLRAFCLDAAHCGIPSLNIPYGLVIPQAVEWSLIPQTVAAVLGPRSVEAIATWGTVKSRLEIAGSPRHDDWGAQPSAERILQERASLGLPRKGTIICYLSVPEDINRLGSQDGALRASEKKRLLDAVREACLGLSDGFLMVVAHPEESIEEIERALGPNDPKRIRVLRARSIRQIIELSDVAVTSHSMTGLEAILLGVPLVTVNLSGRPDPVPYAEDEGAIGVHDASGLLPALERALASSGKFGSRERFLAKHLSRPDGGSARLIARIASRLMAAPAAEGAA
jgi:hypothetical protein